MTALAASNHRIRRLRRLSGRRSARHDEGAFVVEGPTLVAEAIHQGAEVEGVYLAASNESSPDLVELTQAAQRRSVPVYSVVDGVLDGITDTVTPRPVLAVVSLPAHDASSVIEQVIQTQSSVLVLVDVRDPGNVGTIIRAADASGAAGVLCCTGTADPFSPKVVRSAAGSVLHVPVVVGLDPAEVLDQLSACGVGVMATVVEGGTPYDAAPLAEAHALVLGNEAAGLGPDLLDRLDHAITIPMHGRAESLNVAMAASVLCFEAARQRRIGSRPADSPLAPTGESDWTPLPTDDKVITP